MNNKSFPKEMSFEEMAEIVDQNSTGQFLSSGRGAGGVEEVATRQGGHGPRVAATTSACRGSAGR